MYSILCLVSFTQNFVVYGFKHINTPNKEQMEQYS